MGWLQTPAATAGLGWLILTCAVFALVLTAVILAAVTVCGSGPRSKRALAVMQELTRMVAALRKAPPPT
jgi:hypothetical protein